ncbi:MAG TPA: hypothetical protein VIJ91_12950 [Candidatus Dormibacteraeota bacterium]|jgi:uncharacterized membrane protein
MSAPHADQLVHEYLDRLDSLLAGVPQRRREEILDEISKHIAEQRSQIPDESDADLRNLLERIGDPAEVADAARDDGETVTMPKPARRIGPIEVLALVLTPLIWPAGVILLWLSPAWNVRDKLIGMLVPPGGYLFIVFGLPALLVLGPMSECGGGSVNGGPYTQTCTGVMALPVWQQYLIGAAEITVFLLLLMSPILVAIYMTWRLRRWAAEPQG